MTDSLLVMIGNAVVGKAEVGILGIMVGRFRPNAQWPRFNPQLLFLSEKV